jgi:hypothetical protein
VIAVNVVISPRVSVIQYCGGGPALDSDVASFSYVFQRKNSQHRLQWAAQLYIYASEVRAVMTEKGHHLMPTQSAWYSWITVLIIAMSKS